MTIKVGDTVPAVKLKRLGAEGMEEVDTGELFKGRKVVLFSVPGAFTPTCSARHLPGFIDQADVVGSTTQLIKAVAEMGYEGVEFGKLQTAHQIRQQAYWTQLAGGHHVYGHNDFFKNNFTFTSATRAGETIAGFKTRADRVRGYLEDPSIARIPFRDKNRDRRSARSRRLR